MTAIAFFTERLNLQKRQPTILTRYTLSVFTVGDTMIDPDAEIAALRQKSPFKCKSVILALVAGLLMIGLFISLAITVEPAHHIPRWAMPSFALAVIAVSLAFMYAFYYRSRVLIDRGIITRAEFVNLVQVKQNVRVNLAYSYEGKEVSLPIHVPSGLAREVKNAGFVWLVVDPRSPKRAVPLWEFARMKHVFDVASGDRGLADPT